MIIYMVIQAPVIRVHVCTVWCLKGTCDGTVMGQLPPVSYHQNTVIYGIIWSYDRLESEILQIRQDKTI